MSVWVTPKLVPLSNPDVAEAGTLPYSQEGFHWPAGDPLNRTSQVGFQPS